MQIDLKRVWIRAALLITSLTVVLSTIFYLQAGHTLFEPIFAGAPVAKRKLRLCRTRIAEIDWPGQHRIFEDKTAAKARWMAQSGSAAPRELDYLKIEKWFGINCEIGVYDTKSSAFADFLTIHFIDGSQMQIRKGSDSLFAVDGRELKSRELADSLEELYGLGEFNL